MIEIYLLFFKESSRIRWRIQAELLEGEPRTTGCNSTVQLFGKHDSMKSDYY